jgi:guanylate kinase
MNNRLGKIIVVSAASGAGKTTLLDHVRATVPNLAYSVSVTTRKPRGQEIDGVHYFFIDVPEFERRIAANEFAEWQKVHGNYYGSPKEFIDATIGSGSHVVMDIDVYGKVALCMVYPEALGIFVVPPSLEALEQRLRGRHTDSEDDIRLRLANARKEMQFAREKGKYDYTIVNDDIQRAKSALVALVKKLTS